MFILSLAIADLIVGLFVMPISSAYVISGYWKYGLIICQLWLVLDYTASTASIFNLLILSLDRYWSIKSPLKYLCKRTKKRALAMISLVWLLSASWSIPIIFWHSIVNSGKRSYGTIVCDTEFSSSLYFKLTASIFNFIIPLSIMMIIYFKIYLEIKRRGKFDIVSNEKHKKYSWKKTFNSSNNDSINNGNNCEQTQEQQQEQQQQQKQQPNRSLYEHQEELYKRKIKEKKQDKSHLKSQKSNKHKLSSKDLTTKTLDKHNQSKKEINRYKQLIILKTGPHNYNTCENYKDIEVQIEYIRNKRKKNYKKQFLQIFSKKAKVLQDDTNNNKDTDDNIINDSLKHEFNKSNENIYNNHNNNISEDIDNNSNNEINVDDDDEDDDEDDDDDIDEDNDYNNSEDNENNCNNNNNEINDGTNVENNYNKNIKNTDDEHHYHHHHHYHHLRIYRNQIKSKKNNLNNIELYNSKQLDITYDNSYENTSLSTPKHTLDNISYDSGIYYHNKLVYGQCAIRKMESSRLRQEKKAARQLGVILGAFILCWSPYIIMFMVSPGCSCGTLHTGAIWFGYLNSTINPFLYALCNNNFKQAFRKVLARSSSEHGQSFKLSKNYT